MAMEIISFINLDMKHPNAELVNAVQYDSAGIVKAQLLNDGKKWYVPSGVMPAVLFKKSDRNGGYYETTTIDDKIAVSFDSGDRSIIYISLDIQTTTTPGNVNMQVAFFEQNNRLTTFEFLLKVQASPISYADITSKWIFNILSKANLVVDRSLTVSGAAADAKTTGNLISNINSELPNKVNLPKTSPNGVAGQVLRTNGDGTTIWVDVGLPTDAQTAAAINAWLNSHPEATTTVEDGSISLIKMHPTLRPILEYIEVTS